MVTAQLPPQTVPESAGRQEHAKPGEHGRRRPARRVVRGAGVLLDTAWRVVLLGGEIKH